jgi:hypothetical protein
MKEDAGKAGEGGAEATASRPCRCGRAPKRPSQRNCRLCHAEANRRYRASLKKQNEALKQMRKLVVS